MRSTRSSGSSSIPKAPQPPEHRHRDEHWLIVSGEAVLTLNTDEIVLLKGQSVDIPAARFIASRTRERRNW
jgi:mannose-6-phosphate isomerase-like protein (cupin superfamily)